jgi:hypothetical protein
VPGNSAATAGAFQVRAALAVGDRHLARIGSYVVDDLDWPLTRLTADRHQSGIAQSGVAS